MPRPPLRAPLSRRLYRRRGAVSRDEGCRSLERVRRASLVWLRENTGRRSGGPRRGHDSLVGEGMSAYAVFMGLGGC